MIPVLALKQKLARHASDRQTIGKMLNSPVVLVVLDVALSGTEIEVTWDGLFTLNTLIVVGHVIPPGACRCGIA
jgi:hypothetical protein